MPSVEQGAIKISTANAMGNILNKKMGVSTGFAPKDWADTLNLCGKAPEKTVSGHMAHLEDGANAIPIKNWKVTIPANENGVSGLTCTKTKKNMADLSTFVDGYVTTSGTFSTVHSQGEKRSDFIPVNPNTTYYFSIVETTGTAPDWVGIGEYSTNATSGFIRRASYWRFTTAPGTRYIVVSSRNLAQATKIQLELADDPTTYEAYSGTNSTVSLGKTIYGGIADVVNGTLEPINILDSSTFVNGNLETISPQSTHNVVTQGFLPIKGNTEYIYSCTTGTNGVYFRFFDSTQTEIPDSAINAYNATSKTFTTPSNAVYYRVMWYQSSTTIAPQDIIDRSVMIEKGSTATTYSPYFTPTTFTPITPTPETALGVNNFWADANSTSEVTYRRDIDLALGG